MKKMTILVIFFFNILVINAQFNFVKYECDSLSELKIKNELFFLVLDTIIEFEQRCTNYDTNIVFCIHIDTNLFTNDADLNNKYYILISSIDRVLQNDIDIGIFEYKGVLFIVSSFLNQNIFEVLDKKKDFMFYVPWKNAHYNSETGFPTLDVIFERTTWFYYYDGNDFSFHKLSNECGYRKK